MKRGPFSQEQMTLLLRQAERGEQTIQPICRDAGITETTFYRWRRQFGGMETSQAQRLKALEQENARLKRLLAEWVHRLWKQVGVHVRRLFCGYANEPSINCW